MRVRRDAQRALLRSSGPSLLSRSQQLCGPHTELPPGLFHSLSSQALTAPQPLNLSRPLCPLSQQTLPVFTQCPRPAAPSSKKPCPLSSLYRHPHPKGGLPSPFSFSITSTSHRFLPFLPGKRKMFPWS